MFNSKKAQEEISIKSLIHITLAVVLFFTLFYAYSGASKSTYLEKRIVVRDTALILDTIYTMPGNTYIIYPLEKFNFDYKVSKNKVTILGNLDTAFYSFIEDPNIRLKYTTLENSSILRFEKTNNEIRINTILQPIMEKEECPAKTANITQITILPQLVDNEIYSFTRILNILAPNSKIANSIKEKTNTLLKIQPIDKENTVKIFHYPNIESRRLACLIFNNIIKNSTLNPYIIPSNQELLQKANISVLIELGKNLETTQSSSSILNAFKDY